MKAAIFCRYFMKLLAGCHAPQNGKQVAKVQLAAKHIHILHIMSIERTQMRHTSLMVATSKPHIVLNKAVQKWLFAFVCSMNCS